MTLLSSLGKYALIQSSIPICESILTNFKNVSTSAREGLNAVQVDYTDKAKLVSLLRGVNTVLSFVIVASDPGNIAQKTLVDASIEAGVKRFAPNEWATYVLKLPSSLRDWLTATQSEQ